MFIPIHLHLSIGTPHVANLQGAVWKVVACEQCQEQYAYLLEINTSAEHFDVLGMDGADGKAEAQAKAKEQFASQSRNVVRPVPCPQCGTYQKNMTHLLKGEASINRLQIAGFVVVALAFIPLAWNIPHIWVLTLLLALVGLSLLIYGYKIAFGFDPNVGDPEPRKAIGRAYAVWGERLGELLATNPDCVLEPVATAKPQRS